MTGIDLEILPESATLTSHSTSTVASSVASQDNPSYLTDHPHRPASDSLALFLLLPAIAMSLGWGLRGTIGGGQIGALIPGVIVMLSLAHLLGWKSSLGIVAAIGSVGIGLGGQETYGQTIGFLRDPKTVVWGLSGLTLKGAMWGISGGVLVGLAFMHSKYRWWEIAVGLLVMVAVTLLGRELIDKPKYVYFSNLLDKPREEAWVGLTLGGLSLLIYLLALRRENVSLQFGLGGLVAGAAGFGIGSLFLALGNALPKPYFGWQWWKMMEFTFGALYGLGLGAMAYRLRRELRTVDQEMSVFEPLDPLGKLPLEMMTILGLSVAMVAIQLNFGLDLRTSFTVVAAGLILLSLRSNQLGWQVALSLTICGFLRDFLRGGAERDWFDKSYDHWGFLVVMTLPIVMIVARSVSKGRLSSARALLGVTWLATLFGLARITISPTSYFSNPFVSTVFLVEAVATTVLVLAIPSREDTDATA